MKKLQLVLPMLICSSFAQAGTMGAVSEMRQHISPYLTGEAAYTWNSVQPSSFGALPLTQDKNGWGGRLGGGFAVSISDEWALTTEIGGGYYGKVNSTLAGAYQNKLSFDGYDVLFGGLYKLNSLDLFGQAGFMMQNNRSVSTIASPGVSVINSLSTKQGPTQTLPEIKLGVVYNFDNSWEYMDSTMNMAGMSMKSLGLSLAYMHVFGANTNTSVSVDTTSTPASISYESNSQGPGFDAVMFGLRYTLA